MSKQEILNRLDKVKFYQGLIPSLKVNGKPEALGLCPFHDDHSPSLSVNLESGLFRCLACDAKGDIFTFYQKHKGVDFPTALKEIGKMAGIVESDTKSKVVATFKYTDEAGNLLYIKERIEPGRNGKNKEFVFKHLENGKLTLGRGCDPVLYNLPGVMKSKNVIVVEGEGKADLLNSWGLTATCLDSGSNSPIKDEYIQILGSMEKVVVLPDNDTPGRNYACKIANSLLSKVKELKVVELPGLSEAEDVIDWSRVVGNNEEKLIDLVKDAPLWTPKEWKKHNSIMVLTRLDMLFQEPEETTTWLVDGLLPAGGFSIVVAKPKVGKSTLARALSLHVARGERLFDRDVTKGSCVYLALEEKRSEVKRHFQDMGAAGDEEVYIYVGGAPADAINQIKVVVEEVKPVLLIIDPLFRFAKVKDGNDYHQVTNALDPLLRLARDTGTHVFCVHHSRKGESSPEDSFLGSQAIFGSVDTLIVMKRHENYRTIQTIQRYGDDMEETILNFDRETRLITVGGSKQEEDRDMVGNAIVEFLSKQTEPVIEKIINDEVAGRTILKRKALRELIKQDEIVRSGKGGKGDPYRYSCSQNFACSQLENESREQANDDAEKNACSLVPSIVREQKKKNMKTTETPDGCGEDSCSHVPVFPETEINYQERAFLTDNEGKDEAVSEEIQQRNLDELSVFFENQKLPLTAATPTVSNEPINLDELEVEL